MAKWKAPGSDFIQGYWFKRFSILHSRLTEHLQTYFVVDDVPTWMTKGKTTLVQKDPEKGNAVNNYCPVACLPLVWKLLTSVLAEKSMHTFLRRRCYWMSRRNARKTLEEQRTNSLLTSRF